MSVSRGCKNGSEQKKIIQKDVSIQLVILKTEFKQTLHDMVIYFLFREVVFANPVPHSLGSALNR